MICHQGIVRPMIRYLEALLSLFSVKLFLAFSNLWDLPLYIHLPKPQELQSLNLQLLFHKCIIGDVAVETMSFIQGVIIAIKLTILLIIVGSTKADHHVLRMPFKLSLHDTSVEVSSYQSTTQPSQVDFLNFMKSCGTCYVSCLHWLLFHYLHFSFTDYTSGRAML